MVEKYVPLRKGHITTRQNIQMHHVPLPDAEKAIRELGESGLSSREGCGNTMRNVTGDPWAGVAKDELFDLTPYAGAYVRYFVRHPTTQAMPRKIKTAFDGSTARPRDQRHPRRRLPRARAARSSGRGEVRGVEMLVGGGTSIMPRVAPALYDFVELDNGDYLKITEAVLRIFDRQEWLRANRARARIKVFVDKYGIDELRRQVEEELQGDWVAERDFSIEQRLFIDDERESAPAPPAELRQPQRRPLGVRALPRGQRRRAEAGGLRDGRGQGHPRRPHPRAVPRAWRRSCAPTPAATPARPCSRTSCCAGCARRASTTSGGRWASSGSRRRGLARDQRRRLLPGHRLVQARDHQLDGAQRRPSRSASKRWTSPIPLTRKIHIKISGCPNGCGQHHVASIGFTGASIKVGEHTIPAYIPHVGGVFEGGEVALRHAPEAAPARPSASPTRSSAGSATTRPTATRARSGAPSPSASAPPSSRSSSRTSRCRSISAWRR